MSEEDQQQILTQLRYRADEARKEMIEADKRGGWENPGTDFVNVIKILVFRELADIIETLRNP